MNARRDPYPTRSKVPTWKFVDREDPVVWPGGPPGPLSDAQLAKYERDGFLVLEGLFRKELRQLSRSVERVRSRASSHRLPKGHAVFEPGSSSTVRSVFAFHRHDELLAGLVDDERLLGAARQIVGSDAYVHQSRINFKPGFEGRPFQWHSDFETWHSEDGMPRMRAVSCVIALTDNTPHNGPLMLLPGSQNVFVACPGRTPEENFRTSLRQQEVGVPPEGALNVLTQRCGIRSFLGSAGSVAFFDSNTMHGSTANITPMPRHNLFLVYNSVENRLVAPFCGREPRPDYIAAR